MTKYPSFVDRCMNFEGSENLLCFICQEFTTNNNKNQTWETHFTDPLHHLMLEKFNESFNQSSRRNITCKICLELIVKDNVIEHAIEHKLVPWYKSPDVFMTFFFNFIAEINDQYYCHLCEKKFSFWYSALLHVDNQKHQQNHRKKINNDIVNEALEYVIDYQLLISHSTFLKNLWRFECMVCKRCVYGYQNIIGHIKGHSHLENQTTFINKLLGKQEEYVNNRNSEFPEEVRGLLTMSERICDELLAEIDCNIDDEKYKEKRLMENLEEIARDNFPNAIIYRFGSRVSGLGSKNTDLDLFIDCTDEECSQDNSSESITQILKTIEESLRNYPEIWEIERIHKKVRVPIIKAYHKPTGIDCDISLSHRLALENTALIKSYIDAYPLCRKLIIFMETWILKCNLYGYNGLSYYAVTWMVIFYLQCKNILPSVNKLIALKKQSRLIDGWEVGVIEEFEVLSSNQDFMQLLRDLFIFYSKFNYGYKVMCPLLGETVEKKNFKSLELPTAMNPYIICLKQKEYKKFRVFSTMCLQDPFNLSHNLTKNVSKFAVHRLKNFCRHSAGILENNF